MAGRRTAVCTIVAANYLARARVLMESVGRAHPDWEPHVLLVDEVAGRFDPKEESFALTTIGELRPGEPRALCFRYSLLELATALKPVFLRRLFDDGCDRVVYLDPDVLVTAPLSEVERALDAGALLCLTPHLTAPLDDDGARPSEADILRAGCFNLGFAALGRHRRLDDFLAWWWSKTERDCRVDPEAGLFVDQRWLDLAPGLFEGVRVIRSPGYNVAYWNLAQRPLRGRPGAYHVGAEPLVFFHFSGLDPLAPEGFSRYQDRFALADLGDARRLVEDYCAALRAAGHEACAGYDYAFGRLADGRPILDEMRALYRSDAAVEREAGDDPFALHHGYWNEPWDGDRRASPLVSRIAHQIWSSRPDLRRAFPDPGGASRLLLAAWFAERAAVEHAVPDCYVAPVAESLAALSGSRRWRASAGRAASALHPLARHLPDALKLRVRRWLAAPPAGS